MRGENFRQIESYQPQRNNLKGQWSGMREPQPIVTDWDTGLSSDVLKFVGARSVKAPEDFNLHPQLKKTQVEARLKKLEAGTGLDWGTCEALAMGSLLYQGWNVRISGQDVGRATFAHRHAMLVDQDTNEDAHPAELHGGGPARQAGDRQLHPLGGGGAGLRVRAGDG